MTRVIAKDNLPYGKIAHKFEGYRYDDVNVSFFLVDSPPGSGAVLHTHPYEEVFVTLEGNATFTVGDDTIEVGAGQIVVAPANVPHKFVNSGSGPLRQVDIHPSGRIRQVNIPEDVSGEQGRSMAALRGYVGDPEIKFCDHTAQGSCIASRDLIRNAGSYHIPLHCTN